MFSFICFYYIKPLKFLNYKKIFLIESSHSLLILLFYVHFSFKLSTSYLLIMWITSFTLSIIDSFTLLVATPFLYLSTVLTGILYFCYHPLTYQQFLLPAFLLCFFYLLDYFLPKSFGGGDVKILLTWSIFLTYQDMMWLLFISSLLGILFMLLYPPLTQRHVKKLPFVPFLTVALILVSLYFY